MAWAFELIDVATPGGALRNVSLGARMGAVTVLVGPSGSGKTAVFRMLAGLERPDVGAVIVAGHDIGRARGRAQSRIQRRMAIVFGAGTGYGVFAGATVRENVEFAMRSAGRVPRRRLEAVADEELERFGLAAHATAIAGTLRSGEQKRLALARTLAMRAPLVLVDDLDHGLDVRGVQNVAAIVREHARSLGATWLATTSDPAVARLIADDVETLGERHPTTQSELSSATIRR